MVIKIEKYSINKENPEYSDIQINGQLTYDQASKYIQDTLDPEYFAFRILS